MTSAELSFATDSIKHDHKPSVVMRTLNIKKSTYYYKHIPDDLSVRKRQDKLLLPLIREASALSRKTYGVARITRALNSNEKVSFPVGHNRVRRLMRGNGIACETVKRFKPHSRSKVDNSGSNLINRNFKVDVLNTVWVTDITYIFVPGHGFTYLTTFIDLATRKPVGWHYSKDMTTESVIKALKNALINTGHPTGVIIHSDRGSQFTSHDFKKFLNKRELLQSFSAKGCPYDNAVIESFHSSLKKELVYRTYFHSYEHAKLCLLDYIENFYIRVRLHSALGYITPLEMEKRLLANNYAAA